jgi:hypothetical protein
MIKFMYHRLKEDGFSIISFNRKHEIFGHFDQLINFLKLKEQPFFLLIIRSDFKTGKPKKIISCDKDKILKFVSISPSKASWTVFESDNIESLEVIHVP